MTVPLSAASDAPTNGAIVRIAVIGAGASGLSAIKQLVDAFERDDVKAQGKRLEVVGFEKGTEVGGVWYVDEEQVKGKTKAYHHFVRSGDEGSGSNRGDSLVIYPKADNEGEEASPMYDSLRTNLPHDVMSFRDLPSPSQDPLAPVVDYSYQPSSPSSPSQLDSILSSTDSNPSLPSTPTTSTFSSLFPPRREIQSYLERYARQFDLYKYIRFRTAVTRVYLTDRTNASKEVKKWTIHSRGVGHQDDQEDVVEEFDHVCVANGHYADAWTPEVPGMSSFTGQILHSRYYNSPRPFSGQKVLVVGSFASGGDIARLMAVWNEQYSSMAHHHDGPDEEKWRTSNGGSTSPLPLDIHVSCSSLTLYSTPKDDPDQPWGKWITYHPLISHIDDGTVHFQDGSSEGQVDVILFATGYVYAYPFFKRKDAPWNGSSRLPGISIVKATIDQVDKGEQASWEIGGIKGQGVTVEALDDLLMFKRDDRTIAFTGLPYQVAPFPFVECQARLIALYWSGAIPLAPVGHPSLRLPPNPSNPFSSITSSPLVPDESEEINGIIQQLATEERPPLSGPASKRQQLVFNAPFEFEYQDHLMGLMREAGSGVEGKELEPWWKKCEGWRRERRADKGLRKRILGF